MANQAHVRCGHVSVSECACVWVADARLSPSRALERVNHYTHIFRITKKRVTDRRTNQPMDKPYCRVAICN